MLELIIGVAVDGSPMFKPVTCGAEDIAHTALRSPCTAVTGSAEPIILELFGPPGAGKTTLATALIRRTGCGGRLQPGVAWKQQPIHVRLRLLAGAASDLGCLGQAVRTALRLRLSSPESLGRLVRVVLKTAWLRRLSGRAVLDQGFLQDIWSILWASRRFEPDPRILAPLLRRVYCGAPVQIIYLGLDPASAARRIAARPSGRSRLDGVGEGEAASRLECAAGLPGRIVAAARMAGLDVVALDARASPAQLAEEAMRVWTRGAPGRAF